MNKIQNSRPPHPLPLPTGERGRVRGDHLGLKIGIYLGFGICHLEFLIVNPAWFYLYRVRVNKTVVRDLARDGRDILLQ